jgi:DNA-binding XRE family transcriptional regulator
MDTQMKINGDMVRALREEKSWSQEHLADAAGLSVRTVQRVESDAIGSAETRLALAAALSVPVSSLMPPASVPARGAAPLSRLPVGARVGLGIGISCSLGAVAYSYFSGEMTIGEASRSAGILCALLGTTLGTMGAIQGWARGIMGTMQGWAR